MLYNKNVVLVKQNGYMDLCFCVYFYLSSSPRERVNVALRLPNSYSRRLNVLTVLLPTGVRSPQTGPVGPCVVAVRTSLDVVHVIKHAGRHGSVTHGHLRKRPPSPELVRNLVPPEPERGCVPVLGEDLLADCSGGLETLVGFGAPVELGVELAGGGFAEELQAFAAGVEGGLAGFEAVGGGGLKGVG